TGIQLPSDLDGSIAPPSGEPNFYLSFSQDASGFNGGLNLYRFHADFSTPANSTFTGPFSVQGLAPFSIYCNDPAGGYGGGTAPQPGTTERIDTECGTLM